MSFKQENNDHTSREVTPQAQGGRSKVSRGPVNHKLSINEEFASELFTGEHNVESVKNNVQPHAKPVSERSAWN